MSSAFQACQKCKVWAKKGGFLGSTHQREVCQHTEKRTAASYEALTMPANRLSLQHSCYKIKLRNDGYRLAYTVTSDDEGNVKVTVTVVAVDRRDEIYEDLHKRLAGK